jgi:ABC-type Fe3+/spermidine/putrescine transport system ATPase subunit
LRKSCRAICEKYFRVRSDAGRILVNDRDISRLPPERQNFGMVFQGYALFPHLSAIDNVAFSLRARGVARDERRRRAGQAIDMVRLSGLENRLPRQLIGRPAAARGACARDRVPA